MDDQRKIVTRSPENSETPLDAVCSWVTPTRLFFVRNHFDVPHIDALDWRLAIGGCVGEERTFTLHELSSLPQRTVFSTVECAGNGRSFLQPKQHGVQWGAGAIAHAEWTGVSLRTLLQECRLEPHTVEILFEGADRGTEPGMAEPISFARSLPVDKATHPDTLIALRMNGEPLTPEHGFPARLLVPGWYGVASVKWLTTITALAEPFQGYYQTQKYTIRQEKPAGAQTVSVGPMAVKSEIIRPREGERLGRGTQRIFGVAWAGEDAVAKVEISTDGGRTWSNAEFIGLQAPYSWAMWEYLWEVTEPGPYQLMARAVGARGDVQPSSHDPGRGGYMINFVRPRRIEVIDSPAERVTPANLDAIVYDMNAFAEANASAPLDVFCEFSGGAGI